MDPVMASSAQELPPWPSCSIPSLEQDKIWNILNICTLLLNLRLDEAMDVASSNAELLQANDLTHWEERIQCSIVYSKVSEFMMIICFNWDVFITLITGSSRNICHVYFAQSSMDAFSKHMKQQCFIDYNRPTDICTEHIHVFHTCDIRLQKNSMQTY